MYYILKSIFFNYFVSNLFEKTRNNAINFKRTYNFKIREYKNDKKEGKGIYYYNNGDREMGNYLNDKRIGKHVKLHADGSITSKVY